MKYVIAAGLLLMLLTSCAAPPPPPKKQDVSTARPQEVRPSSGNDYLEQARQVPLSEQGELLLLALERWQSDNNCDKALKVAQVLEQQPLKQAHRDRLLFVKGNCLVQLGHPEMARTALQKVSHSPDNLPQRLVLTAQIEETSGRHWQAALARAELTHLEPQSISEVVPALWQNLQQLPSAKLYPDVVPVYLQPWLTLARITRNTPGSLVSAVEQWQQDYPQYPLPQSLSPLLENPGYTPRHIGVLLPLSGRLSAQGEALKQGMLSAYFTEQVPGQPQLTFVDTNRTEASLTEAQTAEFDFIIGPLLRQNIRRHITTPPGNAISPTAPTGQLFLNRLQDNERAGDDHYFYALAPEDEAEQLVDVLSKADIHHPIVISAGSDPYKRMAEHFVNIWQEKHGTSLSVATFSDNKSMREVVSEALNVSHSEDRIELMQRLVQGEPVFHFARNRRDLDGIVLFASAGQTELLNPIIESNISPFARILPVYGSSHSYSQELGPNSLRDLHNLNFIDMPWILASSDTALNKQEVEKLWPQRHDGEARLFAMGYDALMMVSHLRQMALIPGMRLSGLTGELWMDERRQLHRHLSRARITADEVLLLNDD